MFLQTKLSKSRERMIAFGCMAKPLLAIPATHSGFKRRAVVRNSLGEYKRTGIKFYSAKSPAAAAGGRMRSDPRSGRRSVEIDRSLGLLGSVPPPSGIRRGRHGAVQAQVSGGVPARSRRAGAALTAAVRRRYLLCELVSEDARCRLNLDDRVLSGLVRDAIARVHGAFGAAACSVGFAGTRAPRMGARGRFAGEARPASASCTLLEGSRKAWSP